MPTARRFGENEKYEGVELAELSLRDEDGYRDEGRRGRRQLGDDEEENGEMMIHAGHDDEEEEDGEGREGDRRPLLAEPGESRAARRAERARKRAAEASLLRRQLRLLWKTLCGLLALGTLLSAAATLIATIELRRHLGRLFFAFPLTLHLLVDSLVALAPLLCARGDGESVAPAPVPTSQVEFQRQLRAGRTVASSLYGTGSIEGCGCDEVTGRLRISRGMAAWLGLLYSSTDAFVSSFLAVGSLSVAWLTAVEADRTVAREWRGMHTALLAVTAFAGAAALVRVLAAFIIGTYLLHRHRLRVKLKGRQPPWHSAMSRRMERVAIRQGTSMAAVSGALFMAVCGSWIWHSDLMVHTGRAGIFDKCDPLDTTLCALPFPSSYFLEDDESTATGLRVSFGEKSLPFTRGREHVPPEPLNAFDGFSTLAPILFYLEGMSAAGLVGPDKVGLSLLPNSSTTWLIQADTGVMVPHFTELDAMDPRSSLAVLQPAAPLKPGTRYIVAVCGAEGEMGELLLPTPGFRELVEAARADRLTKLRPDLRRRAERFSAEVFPVLRKTLGMEDKEEIAAGKEREGETPEEKAKEEAAEGADPDVLGLGLGEVQLAWDFVTASEDSQLGLLRHMRAVSMSWLDATLPSFASSVSDSAAEAEGAGGGGGGRQRERERRRELLVTQRGDGDVGSVSDGEGQVAPVAAKDVGDDSRKKAYHGNRKSGNNARVSSEESALEPRGQQGGGGDYKVSRQRRAAVGRGGGGARSRRSAAPPSPAPSLPYRVIDVEADKDISGNRTGGIGDGDYDGRDPIARTVWARMPLPAFTSPSSRGSGFTAPITTADAMDSSRDGNGAGGRGGTDRSLLPKNSATSAATGGDGGDGGNNSGRRQLTSRLPSAEKTETTLAASTTTTSPRLEVGFVVRVPRCVASGERAPSMIVQYGHGLFGDRAEVLEPFLGELAERGAWVLVAADWRGMSRIDLPVVARALVAEPELLLSGIPENLMQGFVNQEAVLTLVSRRLADFLGDDGAATLAEGTEVPSGFYGISQGAILGAGYSQFSSLIRRTVLGSGGTPFAFLIPRSVDFLFYHKLLDLNVPRARDVRLLLSLLQMSWDRLEGSAWLAAGATQAAVANGNVGAGTSKAVLMQGGTGDSEVSLIGTAILARAHRAKAVSPAAVPVWGVPQQEASLADSCQEENAGVAAPDAAAGAGNGLASNGSVVEASLALYDYHREALQVPDNDLPPPNNWVHMCVRHDEDAQQQVLHFMETGCVVNYCNGPCERPYCRAG